MGTQVITRRDVTFYEVTKNTTKSSDDSLKTKFRTLPEARDFGRNLLKSGNFKALNNSNGVILPL